MDQLYIDILHNHPVPDFTPRASEVAAQYSITVTCTLGVAVNVKSVDAGRWHQQITVGGNATSAVLAASDNERFVITEVVTDALVGAFQVPVGGYKGNSLTIDDSYLVTPNDLGPPPQPTKTTLIPQDSYPIVVGITPYSLIPHISAAVAIVRYQYWHRIDDSYSLGIGEEQTITTSTTTGLMSTSSTRESVAASLGMSGSVSWWVVSASINASLNISTTSQQSVTVTETSTTYISKTLSNAKGTSDIIVMHWQLIDTVAVLQNAPPATIVASFAVAYAPTVVQTYSFPPPSMESMSPGHHTGGSGLERL